MVEKQFINGKDVWFKVDPYHVQRANHNIIPTEYFTATCYLEEPTNDAMKGDIIKDDDGEPKLFLSPVEALSFVRKKVEAKL